MLRKVVLSSLLFLFTAVTAYAVPLPWLDYGGSVSLLDGEVEWSSVVTTNVVYADGSLGYNDNILGAAVVVSDFYDVALGTLSAGGATFSLISGSSLVFSADLVDITLLQNYSTYVVNPSYSANLQNVWVDPNFDSEWLREISLAAGAANDQSATSITLTFVDLADLLQTGDGIVNVAGKIAPVPEPATLLLLGSGLVGLAFLKRRKF